MNIEQQNRDQEKKITILSKQLEDSKGKYVRACEQLDAYSKQILALLENQNNAESKYQNQKKAHLESIEEIAHYEKELAIADKKISSLEMELFSVQIDNNYLKLEKEELSSELDVKYSDLTLLNKILNSRGNNA